MSRVRFILSLSLAVPLIAAQAGAAGHEPAEASRGGILEGLSARHGFTVSGLSRVEGNAGSPIKGTVIERIERLLADYNYVLLRRADGMVERLIVTGRKRYIPPPPPRGTVTTRRRGRHHIVEAVLRGPNGSAIATPLMVDTGASTIVLPSSMIERLGFARNRLRKTRMKTANRTVEGRTGVLTSVDVADLSTPEVRVAFVDDDRLLGARLLGMSFLGRFRVTIDDENNRITLVRNE